MAYLDRKSTGQKLATLGTAGAIELAIGAALIAGLSITVVQREEAPQLSARNIPAPPPPQPPEPQPERLPDTSAITAPRLPLLLDPIPAPIPTPDFDIPLPPAPKPSAEFTPQPPKTAPSPRFTPVSAAPSNAPARWVTTADYPARDLREGNQGTTRFRVIVGTDGKVKSCEVTGSSGFASLDKATCANVTRRARFDPAIDGNGAKVTGSYSSSVRWEIPR